MEEADRVHQWLSVLLQLLMGVLSERGLLPWSTDQKGTQLVSQLSNSTYLGQPYQEVNSTNPRYIHFSSIKYLAPYHLVTK